MRGWMVGRGRVVALTAAVVPLLAVWNNLVVSHLPGYPDSYVPANAAAAGVLIAAARASGLSWTELGLARCRLHAGLVWGSLCGAAVGLGYAVAVAVPGLRTLLQDERTAGLDAGEFAAQVLVRIPLGTVLWEEVAFRGVLLAALLRLVSSRRAVAISAGVFGLWHVRPALSGMAANDLLDGPVLPVVGVGLVVVATAAAGVVFVWVRMHSGSVLAPALLHWAVNGLGTLAGLAAHQLD